MNNLLTLGNGDVLELANARGTTLHVTRGTLWLTQERDSRDLLLEAGSTWTVERQGLTVGEAQGDTGVMVIGRDAAQASIRSRDTRWRERAARWLTDALERHLRRDFVPHL